MIWYILFLKLKKQISSSFTTWKTIGSILGILSFGFYGFLYSISIDEAKIGGLSSTTPKQIFGYTLLTLGLLTFLRMVLPNYTIQKNFFSNHYPISNFQQYHYSVVSDFINQQVLYFSIFILSATFFLKDDKTLFFTSTLSVLISVQLLKRFLQYFIDNRLKFKSLIALITTPILITIGVLTFKYNTVNIFTVAVFFPIYFFFIGLFLEYQIIETKKKTKLSKSRNTNFYIKLFINNSKIKRLLLIGMSIKLLVIVSDFIYFKTTGENLFAENRTYYWLFASPLMIFTYYFNNTWGFFKSIWINYQMRTGDYSDLRKISLKLMLFPIIIDMLCTLPILVLRWDDATFVLTFYFTSLLFLMCFSFLWSIAYPMNPANKIKKKGNSSILGLIVSFFAISLISGIQTNSALYLVVPLFIIIGTLAFFLSSHLYAKKKYELFEKLS